jgi:hypothetical protein
MESLSGIGVPVLGILRQIFTWPILAMDGGSFYAGSVGVGGARFWSGNQSGSVAAVTDAPVSGQRLVITDIRFSSDTQLRIDFIDMGDNSALFSEYVNANAGGQITLRGKLKLSTADGQLGVMTSAAGNVAVTVVYYSEP